MKSYPNISKIVAEVREAGFSVCEGFLPEDKCIKAKASIDGLLMNYPSAVSLSSSDSRIFGSEFLSYPIRDYLYDDVFVNETLCQLYGIDKLKGRTILAQYVEAIPGNSGSGGFWHRDSLPDQYKAFLYFNEITDNGGPLQILPETHKTISKVITAIKRGRHWNSLDYDSGDVLERLLGQNISEISITAMPGTLVFANTSILHRGKPGLKRERYSATYYAFKTPLPHHINGLVTAAKNLA